MIPCCDMAKQAIRQDGKGGFFFVVLLSDGEEDSSKLTVPVDKCPWCEKELECIL